MIAAAATPSAADRPSGAAIQAVPLAVLDCSGSTEDLFWRWRETLALLFDVAVDSRAALQVFDATLSVRDFGMFVLARAFASAQILRRSQTSVARSCLDHHAIWFHGGRPGSIVANGEVRPVRAGCISLLDLARPVEIHTEGLDDLILILPRETLLPLASRADALHGLVIPDSSALGSILSGFVASLYAEAELLADDEIGPMAESMSCMVLPLVGQAVHEAERAGGATPHPMMTAIRRFIEAHVSSDRLNAAVLSREFNLSRASLYRMFAAEGGVENYIRERRLARALRDITSPALAQRRIRDIAYGWGFHNESAFSRTFRRSFGLSPRQARLASQHNKPQTSQRSGLIDSKILINWIRGLRPETPATPLSGAWR